MKIQAKIEPFFYVFISVLVIIAILTILTFRSVFSALSLASDVGNTDTESELKIQVTKVKEAIEYVNKNKSLETDTPSVTKTLTPTVPITPTQ